MQKSYTIRITQIETTKNTKLTKVFNDFIVLNKLYIHHKDYLLIASDFFKSLRVLRVLRGK